MYYNHQRVKIYELWLDYPKSSSLYGRQLLFTGTMSEILDHINKTYKLRKDLVDYLVIKQYNVR